MLVVLLFAVFNELREEIPNLLITSRRRWRKWIHSHSFGECAELFVSEAFAEIIKFTEKLFYYKNNDSSHLLWVSSFLPPFFFFFCTAVEIYVLVLGSSLSLFTYIQWRHPFITVEDGDKLKMTHRLCRNKSVKINLSDVLQCLFNTWSRR